MKSPGKKKSLIVIGDRVLIEPENASERTEVGLILPQTVLEKEQVQAGRVVAVGPGIPLPDLGNAEDEPWQQSSQAPRYVPVQVEEGDFALFLKKAAIEIKWDDEKFLIVPQAAVLVVVRNSPDEEKSDLNFDF
ncbi:MAG: co-chaperone GroES [Deferribacteres bacterium]|nr:co-chaperone GroES [candidate division KSB1 bacterium]MCB9511622.1 co-chaperone GroES [Deferribacteres bacterium]